MTGPFSLEVTISIMSKIKSVLAIIKPGDPPEMTIADLDRERSELMAEASELNRQIMAEDSFIAQAVASRDPDKIAQAEEELTNGNVKATARLKVIAALLEANKFERDQITKKAREDRWTETKSELVELLVNFNSAYTQAAEACEAYQSAHRKAQANGFTHDLGAIHARLPVISTELAKRFHHSVEVVAGKVVGPYGARSATFGTTGRFAADFQAEQQTIADHKRITFPTDPQGRRISDANLPTARQKEEAARPTVEAGERPAPNYVRVKYIQAGCPIHTVDGPKRSKAGDEVWVIREVAISHVAQTLAVFVDQTDLAQAVTDMTAVPKPGPSPKPRETSKTAASRLGKPREETEGAEEPAAAGTTTSQPEAA